jgi:putative DNA primase/helicase|nr:virulence-associated E family protein [uncultured Acetatifactor sp.]
MYYDKQIKIATGGSRKAVSWVVQETTWSALLLKLSQPARTTETFQEYKSLPRPKQDDLKDVGGFVGGVLAGPRRKKDAAGERYLVTLDADTIEPGGTQGVLNAVSGLGCAYAVYSTRKHEGAAPRLRIVVPLDEPCTAEEYEPIARKLASFLGMQIFDPTTFESVRLMYWPSCSADSEFIFLYEDRPFLSRSGMLGLYRDWRDVAEWPEVPGAAKIRDRSAKKQGDPLEKAGVVGAFCRCYSIEAAMEVFIPGTYEPCGDGRYTYAGGSTVGGAVLYEDGKFLYSHHATDPCSGKLCNAFDMVRLHRFGDEDADAKPDTPAANLPSFLSMCRYAAALEPVAQLLNRERYEKAVQGFGTPVDTSGEDFGWLSRLATHPKTGRPLATVDNVQAIIENDPLLKGRIYHDDFSDRPMVCGQLPWEKFAFDGRHRLWRDQDDAGLRGYMESHYGIGTKNSVLDGFAVYALNHRVNFLKDYLASLRWDGVPRVDTLLVDYFGAEDNTYSREAIRKCLAGAIARLLSPGVKFDQMLILVGPQGAGKSTFWRMLGMRWYTESLYTFEGKEAAELLQGYWIVECGELAGMTKSERNAVKQFISRCEDTYRAAYGRRTENYPRRCLLVGTTNEKEFLKDETGERRFWPVDLAKHPPRKDPHRDLPGEVPMIWAEALQVYLGGESLLLSQEAEMLAKESQECHKESDPNEGVIAEFLQKKVPAGWYQKSLADRRNWLDNAFNQQQADESRLVYRDRICALEVWNECYRQFTRMKKSEAREINAALGRMPGWKRAEQPLRFGKDYGVQRGFVRDAGGSLP